MKTTSPKKYFVRPNTGVIHPWDSCFIRGATLNLKVLLEALKSFISQLASNVVEEYSCKHILHKSFFTLVSPLARKYSKAAFIHIIVYCKWMHIMFKYWLWSVYSFLLIIYSHLGRIYLSFRVMTRNYFNDLQCIVSCTAQFSFLLDWLHGRCYLFYCNLGQI